LFHRRFHAALEKAVQDGTSLYLMLIDLDDFKDVNDTLGYDAGTGFVLTRERETGVRPISDMSLAIMVPVFRADRKICRQGRQAPQALGSSSWAWLKGLVLVGLGGNGKGARSQHPEW
jgi:predicted signal transduction protein with EAL and GGDEF domain